MAMVGEDDSSPQLDSWP